MKKILVIFLLCSSTFVFAQDLVNKKGIKILPDNKSIAFGLGISPILNFAGNMFNGEDNNNFNLSTLRGSIINLKYTKSEKTAFRLAFNPYINSRTNEYRVADDLIPPGDPNNNAKVSDFEILNTYSMFLFAGIEKRKSKGRLIGFLGADLGIGFSNNTRNYTYGNDFSETNPYPTSSFTNSSYDGYRLTSYNNGFTFIPSLRPFVGLEYFICPNISITAEYGIAAELVIKQQGLAKSELWEFYNKQVRQQTTILGRYTSFNLKSDNLNAALGLYIYL